jgi:hypothetical protein
MSAACVKPQKDGVAYCSISSNARGRATIGLRACNEFSRVGIWEKAEAKY